MLAGPRLRLSFLHAAGFLGLGVYLPFFPVWLAGRGLDPATIGIILTIPIVTRILVTAPLMSLADGSLGVRGLLLASLAAQVLVYVTLGVLDGAVAIAVGVAVMAAAQAAIIPANDLVTMEAVRRDTNLSYGGVRVWGSIAFLAANVGAGYLVEALGSEAVIWVLAGLPVLGLAATIGGVPPKARTGAGEETPVARSGSLPGVLWLVMIGAVFIQATHGALYALASLHWRSLGFSDPVIGYLWAVGVVTEIVLFAVLGHLKGRRAALGLILVGGVAAVARFALMAADPGLAVSFLCQTLHGFSFGATHLGTIAAVTALAPATLRGRAQGLLGSLMAFGMASSTFASGLIYREAGPTVFLAMVPLALVGVALTLWAGRRPSQPQSDGAGG